ncbi:50S ribosomal protein L4 [Clostridia bacterium]|nr:50S ribosomal protein L4 [Clostridia bacterium]
MSQVNLYKQDGTQVGTYELDDAIFGVTANVPVLHAAVVTQLANKRQGTKSTLTRAEVRGGGIKPRPQKGSGRSRQGSIRSPQWTGGGIVFAPKPRDFSLKLNKKVKRLALKGALSAKLADGKIIVLDSLDIPEIKTKAIKKVFDAFKVNKALLVIDGNDKNIVLSARNIPGVQTASVNTINVYDILKYDSFIITKDAADKVQEVYK